MRRLRVSWRVATVFGVLTMSAVGEARQLGAPSPPTMFPPAIAGANVTLSWVASPAGGAPASYRLEAGTAPGLSNVAIVTLAPFPTSFNVAAPVGTYFVRVIALNAAGASGPSNEIVVVIGGSGPCLIPGAPTGLQATTTPGGVSLRWDAAPVGGVPTGYSLLAGSFAGGLNIGVFALGLTSAISSPAPPGTYFVRVVAANACGSSAPSAEAFFTIGAPAGPLTVPAGNYVGNVFNFSKSFVAPIVSFSLQLNQPIPASNAFQVISGRWADNRGCVKTTGIVGNTDAVGPGISLEAFTCNDGDFGLRVNSVTGNVYSGVCSLGGPNCTFTMIRQ